VLDEAETLQDLAALPGNHLEALRGDRKGQHSIRINDQYRICFVWADGTASCVALAAWADRACGRVTENYRG
jgi:proteic killer suppression protein